MYASESCYILESSFCYSVHTDITLTSHAKLQNRMMVCISYRYLCACLCLFKIFLFASMHKTLNSFQGHKWLISKGQVAISYRMCNSFQKTAPQFSCLTWTFLLRSHPNSLSETQTCVNKNMGLVNSFSNTQFCLLVDCCHDDTVQRLLIKLLINVSA